MSKGDEAFKQCLAAAGVKHYDPKYVVAEQRPAYDRCAEIHHPTYDTSDAVGAILLAFLLLMLFGYGAILISSDQGIRRRHDRYR